MSHYLYKNISTSLGAMALIMMILFTYLLAMSKSLYLEWVLGGGSLSFSVSILIDSMGCLFLAVVMCISCNVIWYSQSYMASDSDANRFILLVLGFVIAMVILIVSPNIVSILLGWDGLGLISYCLVIYYPTSKSSSAGMLTVLSNRVGDVCILLSIGWFGVLGDFNFPLWVDVPDLLDSAWLPLLIILGAMTKSAQIPFSAWLPAAMAAPTPVSALVHSSTLVTAGVYLLIRFSSFLETAWSPLLMVLSTLTMFMAGVVAIYEYDLKKIVALSTLSQLGVMMFSISLGLYDLAFFHLITHALFKALLFLCAGALIHGVGGSQDIRHFGGLAKSYPLVGSCMNLANLSLCGIPFLSGFYSKDAIVEAACQNSWNLSIIVLMFVSLAFTVVYSVRLVYLSYVQHTGGFTSSVLCDLDSVLTSPVIILTLLSIISGSSLAWLFLPTPSLVLLPPTIKMLVTYIVTSSALLTLVIMYQGLSNSSQGWLKTFNGFMWFLPVMSSRVSHPSLNLGEGLLKVVDQGWSEWSINSFLFNLSSLLTSFIWVMQTNSLKTHLTVMIIWFGLMMSYA